MILLLTNFKEQLEANHTSKGAQAAPSDPNHRDPQRDMALAEKAISKFHAKLFDNYKKWCKYIGKKPNFNREPLVDIVLFFLIWGEAGNFRQMPECLCFLFHNLAPSASSSSSSGKEPGDFLARCIRPMYNELKRDSDKKTSKGARAPHREIRNYDDFNEFFWSKKCLKYNAYTIGANAFGSYDKNGNPKIVKKTFTERRTWLRALTSFRRIFLFNLALFFASVGFSLNMILLCPDSPIMYGPDMNIPNVFGKQYQTKSSNQRNEIDVSELTPDAQSPGGCNPAKLATCLGVENYIQGTTFALEPLDFKQLLEEIPFTKCVSLTSGRCSCYLDLIDTCWSQTGTAKWIEDPVGFPNKLTSFKYDQSKCIPAYKKAALKVLEEPDRGIVYRV